MSQERSSQRAAVVPRPDGAARIAFLLVATQLAAVTAPRVPTPATAQQGESSLEAIMSAPFRSGLVAAPSGARLAWVEQRDGVRNIHVAEGPDFIGHAVTRYAADDGATLGALAFTPDGSLLVYVRGDGRNRTGEFPNPTSDPGGRNQDIWIVPVAGGEPRRVAAGTSPAIAPDGQRLAFLQGGAPYVVPLDGSAEPERMFHARGGTSDLQWSPDGGRLAFVSGRRDHAYIGVYDVGGRTLRWISPSPDRDRSPRWSPDGERLAFYRFDGPGEDVAYTGFGPVSEPFGIRVGRVATGESEEVWHSGTGDNRGFANVSGSRDLLWAAGGQLVFPAETGGWVHMYRVPAAGGAAVDLTPGECIVEDAALSPDGEWLYYNHNCEEIDRRQLARVRVSGGAAERLTGGATIDWSPVLSADGRTLAFIRSDARHPGAVHRMPAAGGVAAAVSEVAPAGFPAPALVEPQPVVLTAEDGVRIHAQLLLPRDRRAGERRPAAIFLHGGSRRQMLLGWHYSGYYHNTYAFNQHLAASGYVVLAINYRSGIGYGKAFRQPAGYGWQGAAEYRDVVAAGRYLASRSDVDATRIGLWGGSYGGYLTALGLARDSDLFAAGVDLHGVHDWVTTLKFWGSRIFEYDARWPGRADSLAALAFASSPNADIRSWRSPVLLVHGDDDRNVDFNETVELIRLLRERGGVEFEALVFPDEVHGFLLHRSWLAAFRAASAFFDRRLRPGARAAAGR